MSDLRIGLVVDSNTAPAWAGRMIDHIVSDSLASIAYVINIESEFDAVQNNEAGWVRRCLNRFETFLIGSQAEGNSPLELVDLAYLSAPVFGFGDAQLACSAQAERAALNCDMLISLVKHPLTPDIYKCARLGVWDIVVGSTRTDLSTIEGHFEALTSEPVTESFLRRRHGPEDIGDVLYSSTSCTEAMSVAANALQSYWKASFYVPRVIASLQTDPHALENGRQSAPDLSVRKISSIRYAIMLLRKFLEKLGRKWRDVFFEQQWILGLRRSQELPDQFSEFEKLVPPGDRFWADPFLFEHHGKNYLFFEELQYQTNRGEILAVELDQNGFVGDPEVVLAKDFHLSYPFVFEFDGEIYMVPESYDNRSVDLYRSTNFPGGWQQEACLFSGRQFVDVTIHEHGGTYWLFANVCETDEISPWDELYLFYSDSPISNDWTPHPANPVVSDVRTSRPAGRVFSHKDKLVRPSQNCAPHYGYGLNFCEIVELTKTRYIERVWRRFEPDWSPSVVSLHTYNELNGIQVTDFQERVRKSR